MILLEPIGEGGEALHANIGVVVEDGGGGARAVAVEVLVDVEGEVLRWIDDVEHGCRIGSSIPRRRPGPGAGPAVARHEDEIVGAGRANDGDGGVAGRD